MSSLVTLGGPRGAPLALPSPASIELEQAFLGALILYNDLLHESAHLIQVEHFSEGLHQQIFTAVAALISDGRVADPKTLLTVLPAHEVAHNVSMKAYVAKLAADAVPRAMVHSYGLELIRLKARRDMVAIGESIKGMALDPPAAWSMEILLDKAEEEMAGLRSAMPAQKITRGWASESADRLLDRIERVQAGEKIDVGATTGIPKLDRDTGGLEPGLLWIVAGRPGMGKTIAVTNIARAVATSGAGTLLFELEVAEDEITARILADLAYSRGKPLRYGDIKRGKIDAEDLPRVRVARQRLAEIPLAIDWSSRLSVAQIASRVRAERLRMVKAGIELKVVLIDYIDFVQASDRYKGNRVNEVGEITAGLKQLAKDEHLCVVLLCQLNRAIELRADKRPMLADLRDSGNIEQDADVVLFMYREAYYIKASPEYRRVDPTARARFVEMEHELEMITAKVRSGPPQTYKLWVDVACSKLNERDLSDPARQLLGDRQSCADGDNEKSF